jgi:transposase
MGAPAAVPPVKSNAPLGPLNAAERQELVELRRKLRQVQMERDILAKATAWFAGKSERASTTSTGS